MNKLLLRSNEIIRWKNPVSHYLLSLVCMFGCLSLAHGKGAVKEGLVAYWSFDQATFNKKEIKDDFSGLVGEVILNLFSVQLWADPDKPPKRPTTPTTPN